MDTQDILAFRGPAGYIVAILILLTVVLKSIPWIQLSHRRIGYLFVFLAFCSFLHTFYYILVFYTASFTEYEARAGVFSPDLGKRITVWLAQASLFEEARLKASARSVNWWWSEQICTYAIGPWTVFLFVEGQRHQIRHLWAYMLLGQLVAVSVPANLFYLALVLSGREFKPGTFKRGPAMPSVTTKAPPLLWISILLSLVTVANSPYTDADTFLPNLLLMHALIVVPFLFITSGSHGKGLSSGWFSIPYSTLHTILYAVILTLRVKTTLAAVREGSSGLYLFQNFSFMSFCKAIIEALHSHPGQATIGWDVIWSTSSFVIWTCLDRGFSLAPLSAIFASAGVVSSWVGASAAFEKEEVKVEYTEGKDE
ncbi:hypothetical protein E1B28_012510 [Marasmius oreades]|uniref:Uncharacterized protein n=1 Tax=Marasmius oreades TaxID=181124 RepID=A0A9P7RRW3_9AGAR|nr:uncharacterized protein E1B28_012510 [Marasmius oreades]KAG7088527.1 hypothetical protein E1B28_012510 [Marasmius oreades]